MKILSQLSPAETLMVTNPVHVSLKELMKVTIMDLLLKQALEIRKEERVSRSVSKIVRVYTYIYPGKNFKSYKPKPHEKIFLSPFNSNPNIKVILRQLIKMSYEKATTQNFYKGKILKNKSLKKFHFTLLPVYLFGQYDLNTKGKEIQKEVREYLQLIDDTIVELIKIDRKRAIEMLLKIGGNLFLLENLEYDLLRKLNWNFSEDEKQAFEDGIDRSEWWRYLGMGDDSVDTAAHFNYFDENFETEFEAGYDFTETEAKENEWSDCSACSCGCD